MRYEVQHHTLCDGWVNTWTDGDGKPITYHSAHAAHIAINDYLSEIEDQIREGDRHPEHGYDRSEFRIMPVTP